VVRLANNPATIKGAKAAWRAYVQKYGSEYDPNGYNALLLAQTGVLVMATLPPAYAGVPQLSPATKEALISTMLDVNRSPIERADAGRRLAELGDPRPG